MEKDYQSTWGHCYTGLTCASNLGLHDWHFLAAMPGMVQCLWKTHDSACMEKLTSGKNSRNKEGYCSIQQPWHFVYLSICWRMLKQKCCNSYLMKGTKLRVANATIISTLTYRCETCTLQTRNGENVCWQMRALRQIEGGVRLDRIRNVDVWELRQ